MRIQNGLRVESSILAPQEGQGFRSRKRRQRTPDSAPILPRCTHSPHWQSERNPVNRLFHGTSRASGLYSSNSTSWPTHLWSQATVDIRHAAFVFSSLAALTAAPRSAFLAPRGVTGVTGKRPKPCAQSLHQVLGLWLCSSIRAC